MTALSVTASGPAADAIATPSPQLVEAQFASKLFAKDPTLWGAGGGVRVAKPALVGRPRPDLAAARRRDRRAA